MSESQRTGRRAFAHARSRSGRTLADFPDLLAEWHPANGGFPAVIPAGTARRVSWRCSRCQHEWATAVKNRTGNGSRCPACSGKVATAKNNLLALHPEIAAEWDLCNHGSPDQVTSASNKRVTWRCAHCQHQWTTAVSNRTRGDKTGCPACSNKTITGPNSLQAVRPDIAADWHPDNHLAPSEVACASNKRVLWLCPVCRYAWRATVASRCGSENRPGRGCPACAGKVATEANSLQALYPALAAEWHPDNHGTPEDVTPGSHKRVRWQCAVCAHCWTATPNSRTTAESGCPECRAPHTHSKAELRLAEALSRTYEVAQRQDSKVRAADRVWLVDILIPEHRLVVEYDGAYWHRDKVDVDLRKTRALQQAGFTVIRIREAPLPQISVHDFLLSGRRLTSRNLPEVLSHIDAVLDDTGEVIRETA